MAGIRDTRKTMLLAELLDGHAGSDNVQCQWCKRPMVRFTASPGLRKANPDLPEERVTCVRACIGAAKSLIFLHAIKEAAGR